MIHQLGRFAAGRGSHIQHKLWGGGWAEKGNRQDGCRVLDVVIAQTVFERLSGRCAARNYLPGDCGKRNGGGSPSITVRPGCQILFRVGGF